MQSKDFELAQVKAIFSKIAEGVAYCKIVTDDAGNPVDWVYLDVNDAYERINGAKRADIVGKRATEVLPNLKRDPADWINLYGQIALTGEPLTIDRFAEVRNKWFHISAYSPQKGYFIAIFGDITERKKTELDLKKSQEMLEQSQEIAHLGSWELDLKENKLIWSDEVYRIFGLKPQEFAATYEAFLATVHPEDRVAVHTAYSNSVYEGKEGYEIEHRVIKQDNGEIRFVHEKCTHVRDESGKIVRSVGMVHDVTERRKAEEEIKTAKEDWERTFDAIPDFVAILDTNHHILRANKAMAKQLSVTPKEVPGLICYECIHGTTYSPDFCPHTKLLKDGKQHTAEVNEPRLGGDFIVSATPLRDGKGNLIGSVHVARNITERKKIEEALRKLNETLEERVKERAADVVAERQRLFDVLETLPAMICLLTPDHHVDFANRAFRERFGESHGRRCHEYCFGSSAPCSFCKSFNVLKTGQPNHWELKIPDGADIEVYDFPFRDVDGTTKVLEMKNDITEKKRNEAELEKYRKHLEQLVAERTKQLQESEQRWVTTLSSIGDAVIATDTEGKVTFMNSVAEKLTGWTLSEARLKPIKQVFRIINEKTRKEVENPVDKVLENGAIVGLANHTLLIRKEGNEIPIDDSGAPIKSHDGQTRGVVLVFRDISERKKTEEHLQRQAALLNLSPDAIIVRSLEGTITFWSFGAEKLYGWTKQEAIGKTTHKLFDTTFPETFERVLAELKTKKRWSGELVHRTKSGKEVTVQSWWLAEKTEHGEIKSILESNVDLTERKKAEKEIARLATFATLNPAPVVEVSLEGKITYANPATKILFPDLENHGLSHEFFNEWSKIVRTFSEKSTNTFTREIKIQGRWYQQQFFLVPYTPNIRVYTTDIDGVKQSEQALRIAQTKLEENAIALEEYANQMEALAEQRAHQLQTAQRLAAIGQTAGMVGHDIRNPLQAITSDMYIIAEEAKALQDDECKAAILESIESVNQNISYINKIVSDLQDYTRPLKPNFQDINLKELIEGTLLTINLPKEIQATTTITDNAKVVRTDIAYLRRVLTNLFTNAVQAMPNEGKLVINATANSKTTIITVQDTGVGIPVDAQTKLFTPLFTTKSKGQGLGLAVVKRLVEALGGAIEFETQENKGTKFIVTLPQTQTVP